MLVIMCLYQNYKLTYIFAYFPHQLNILGCGTDSYRKGLMSTFSGKKWVQPWKQGSMIVWHIGKSLPDSICDYCVDVLRVVTFLSLYVTRVGDSVRR
jgi:hypothetical protein